MSDNRAIVYLEDGIPVYRASSLGNPLRCLTLARSGATALEPPEFLKKAAAAGTAIESVVKEMLVEKGYTIGDEQGAIEIEVPLKGVPNAIADHAIIRGHLDATSITHPDDPIDRMLEVKSMSTNVFDKWTARRFDAFPNYAAQLSIYMAAVGKPALYAVICRDTEELELIPYATPPIDPELLFNKVRSVEAFDSLGIIPPCSGAIYACAYDHLCDRNEISPSDLSEKHGDDSALSEAVLRYDEARAAEFEAKVLKAAARDDVIIAMGSREKADVGFIRVTYKTSTRNKLNMKRLRKRLGDEMDTFYDESKSTTLTVSKTKES